MAFNPRTRLYVECALSGDASITLDKDQTHYLANVMRVKVGQTVALFNGTDGEWLAEITEASRFSYE